MFSSGTCCHPDLLNSQQAASPRYHWPICYNLSLSILLAILHVSVWTMHSGVSVHFWMSRRVARCLRLWSGYSAALRAWSLRDQLLSASECDAGLFDWSCSLSHFLVLLGILLELTVWTDYWYFPQRLCQTHWPCEHFESEIVHPQSSHYSGWIHSWSHGFGSCGARHSASVHLGCLR